MTGAFSAVVLAGLAAIILAGVVLFSVGFHVVKKYPDRNDPDRDRARYTRPAAYSVGVILGGVIAVIVGSVGLIIISLTS